MSTVTVINTKKTVNKRFTAFALAVVMALAVPAAAWAQSLDEAAAKAARQYDAKVLSAHTEQEGKKRVHVIKLLTKDGVVKTVRIPVRER
jgi:uncharacterized membrane protein YkoI